MSWFDKSYPDISGCKNVQAPEASTFFLGIQNKTICSIFHWHWLHSLASRAKVSGATYSRRCDEERETTLPCIVSSLESLSSQNFISMTVLVSPGVLFVSSDIGWFCPFSLGFAQFRSVSQDDARCSSVSFVFAPARVNLCLLFRCS